MQTNLSRCKPIFQDANYGEPDFKAVFQAQLGANLGMEQFFLELEAGKQREV